MTLAGDLIISFADGDPPPVGFYDLIVADSRIGTFDNITAPPNVSWAYVDGSAKFVIQVVPEPSTLLLAVMGILGLAPSLWRRRKA